MAKERKFVYRKRTAADVKERANQQTGVYDVPLKEEYKVFVPKGPDHTIRILPPTWENPTHYGIDIWLCSSIGADKQTYLSLSKMLNKPDPIEEERSRARRAGNDKYADDLAPYRQVLVWVIDRDNESDGPMLWKMPATKIDKALSKLSIDKRTGEVLLIDHPEDGYDVEFSVEGKGTQKQYVGLAVARRATPLHDDPDKMDEWLMYIQDNPLPETLNYYSYEHIKGVFEAAAPPAQESEEEDAPPRTRSSRRNDDDVEAEPEKPKERRRSRIVEEESEEIDDPEEPLDTDEEEDDTPPVRTRPKVTEPESEAEEEEPAAEEEEEEETDTQSVRDRVRARMRSRRGG